MPVETLKHVNIGQAKNGFIGKVKVLKANGEDAYIIGEIIKSDDKIIM